MFYKDCNFNFNKICQLYEYVGHVFKFNNFFVPNQNDGMHKPLLILVNVGLLSWKNMMLFFFLNFNLLLRKIILALGIKKKKLWEKILHYF